MDKVDEVIKSESLSSYSSCLNDDDENPREETKIFTSTKSRLIYYDVDRNSKKSCRSESSLTTLCLTKRRRIFDRNELVKDEGNREITSSIRVDRNSYSQRPTVWQSSDPKKESFKSQAYHGLNKADILTNEYYTEISKNSSFSRTGSRSNMKRECSVQGGSYIYVNNEHKRLDVSLKSKTIMNVGKWETRKKPLQKWHHYELKGELRDRNENTILNKYRNETELSMRENENKVYNYLDIDFQKIKECLKGSSSTIEKFDQLQSILLLLSNQEPDERLSTVQAIVDNDLFDLKCELGSCNMLKDLLWPINARTPHPMQTSAAKLLNAVVSYQIGREYFNEISMVELLTWSSSELIHDSMADNLVATMKKLSLNKFQLHDMLEKGAIQWLVNHMTDFESSASTFHMECVTDLLRMLTNVSTEFSSVNVPRLIVVLVRYLNVGNEYVKINVTHVLRNLLRDESAIEIGNKINLHKTIQRHVEDATNPNLRTELQNIYDLIMKYRLKNSNNSGSATVQDIQKDCADRKEYSAVDRFGSEKNSADVSESSEENCRTDRLTKSLSNQRTEENTHKSVELHQSLSVILRPYIQQLCLDTKLTEILSVRQDHQLEITANAANPVTDVIFSNLNSTLDQNSSLLSSGSQFSGECKSKAIESLKINCHSENVAVDMDNKNTDLTSDAKNINGQSTRVPTDYSSYLNSIARDPIARNEILANEDFIDELCEKVFRKLRTKLGRKNFCGANCNTNCNG